MFRCFVGFLGIHVFAEHDEFVAADACDQIGVAHAADNTFGEAADHQVAGGMAVAVVDRLEEVDVEIEHGQRHRLVTAARDRQRQPLLEVAAIGDAGQRIEACLAFELRFGEFEPGDVEGQREEAADFAIRVVLRDVAGLIVERASGQHRLALEVHGFAGQRAVDVRRQRGVDGLAAHLAHAAADDV